MKNLLKILKWVGLVYALVCALIFNFFIISSLCLSEADFETLSESEKIIILDKGLFVSVDIEEPDNERIYEFYGALVDENYDKISVSELEAQIENQVQGADIGVAKIKVAEQDNQNPDNSLSNFKPRFIVFATKEKEVNWDELQGEIFLAVREIFLPKYSF